MDLNKIYEGDSDFILSKYFDDESVDCCITSPPYWGLRDYKMNAQLGIERTPEDYIDRLVKVFREVRRVLKPEGTHWLNLGDSYARDVKQGSSGAHADYAALGHIHLRQDIIWQKPNPMPESVTDRCTKSHEYIFLLSKSPRYYFDQDAIRVPLKEAHFATFPEKLIEPLVLAGCPEGGVVLDPFMGAGTTGVVAFKNNRNYVGIELNPDYITMAERRIYNIAPLFTENLGKAE
jgi:site-specific DNA-methyltransferase (adenine-specific)